MMYGQISRGRKMHIVFEPGEEHPDHGIVRAGCVSLPLCNQPVPSRGYRMGCNLPLANLCGRCRRRHKALRRLAGEAMGLVVPRTSNGAIE